MTTNQTRTIKSGDQWVAIRYRDLTGPFICRLYAEGYPYSLQVSKVATMELAEKVAAVMLGK